MKLMNFYLITFRVVMFIFLNHCIVFSQQNSASIQTESKILFTSRELNKNDLQMIKNQGLIIVRENIYEYYWQCIPQDRIICNGDVKPLIIEHDKNSHKSICLACFDEFNKLQHMGATIKLN